MSSAHRDGNKQLKALSVGGERDLLCVRVVVETW